MMEYGAMSHSSSGSIHSSNHRTPSLAESTSLSHTVRGKPVSQPTSDKPESFQQSYLLYPCDNPAVPSMRSEAARMESFSRWPFRHTTATPREFVRAGLFYMGSGDQCKCFYCGGGFQDWGLNDDPWEEHAKWFPNCEFLLHEKGTDWVAEVTARHPDLNRPTLEQIQQTVQQPQIPRMPSFEPVRPITPPSPLRPASLLLPMEVTPAPLQIFPHEQGSINIPGLRVPPIPRPRSPVSPIAPQPPRGPIAPAAPRGPEPPRAPRAPRGPEPPRPPNIPPLRMGPNTRTYTFRSHNDEPMVLGGGTSLSVQGSTVRIIGGQNVSVTQRGNETVIRSGPMNNDPPDEDLNQIKAQLLSMDYEETAIDAAISRFRNRSGSHQVTLEGILDELQLDIGEPERYVPPPSSPPTDPEGEKVTQPTVGSSGPCVVCLENRKEMVLVPCGHLSTCRSCARHLTRCPVCRTHIERAVRFFES